MHILITGIHEFVGSNLVAALKGRHELYGLDIVAPDKEGVVKTFSWEDITPENKSGLPHFDAIIHLAGKAHDVKNRSAAREYFDINTGLTRKAFDYFLLSGAKKFIFFSSVKAAADFVEGNELTEDVVPMPVGPYGESKIAAENYIRETFENYRAGLLSRQDPSKKTNMIKGSDWPDAPDGKQVYILRPCMIHGPGNKGNLNLLYNVVRRGIPWPLGGFENRRTFTSIDNLIFILRGLLEKEVSSGIYHIADDEAVSTNRTVELICASLGRTPHIWRINKGFISICATVCNVFALPLNHDRLTKLTENYVVSNTKIKHALGIDRLPITAEEGLLRTLESFKIKHF